MSRLSPGKTFTMPTDTVIAANTVLVASSTAGNAMLPAAAGALGIVGVTQNGSDPSNTGAGSPGTIWYTPIVMEGIVQGRSLTGTAIAVGDRLKVADTAGRVTKLTPSVGTGVTSSTLKGQVGIALSAVASGDASDTLVDIELTPGATAWE